MLMIYLQFQIITEVWEEDIILHLQKIQCIILGLILMILKLKSLDLIQ